MRLLITGSRSWADKDRLWHCLDQIAENLALHHKERYIKEGLTLVSGHAYGADALAEHWFGARFPLETPELWHADWKIGKRAGIVRNTAMVDSYPDVWAAFITPCDKMGCPKIGVHGSHGATHCSDYAESLGIPGTRFYGGTLA